MFSGGQDKLIVEMSAVAIHYQHVMLSGVAEGLEDSKELDKTNIVVGPA